MGLWSRPCDLIYGGIFLVASSKGSDVSRERNVLSADLLSVVEPYQINVLHTQINLNNFIFRRMLDRHWKPNSELDFAAFAQICQREPTPKINEIIAMFK